MVKLEVISPPIKILEQQEILMVKLVVSVFSMVCLSPPVLPSVFPVVSVFFMVCL
jgi:hypothetical protein